MGTAIATSSQHRSYSIAVTACSHSIAVTASQSQHRHHSIAITASQSQRRHPSIAVKASQRLDILELATMYGDDHLRRRTELGLLVRHCYAPLGFVFEEVMKA